MLINFLKLFLSFIVIYYLLNTFLIYWVFDWSFNLIISLFKDFLWLIFIWIVLFFNLNKLIPYLKLYKNFFILLFLYLFVWLVVSLLNDSSIYDIFIWIKYNIYFFIIFLTSTFVWYVLKDKISKDNMLSFLNFVFTLIIVVIFAWIIWQLLKFGFKDEFIKYLWYWNVWDWAFGESPPVYYRTWEDWFPRLSWLFAWPNNYWFFLVAFFSFFIYKCIEFVDKNLLSPKDYIKWLLYSGVYIISWLLTFSRWFIVWTLIQFWYFLPKFIKQSKKAIIWIVSSVIILIIWLTLFKLDSTIAHIETTFDSLHFAINNSTWLWFWTSWPAIHHSWEFLPENTYLQVFIDTWAIGFIIWVAMMFLIFIGLKTILDNNSNSKDPKTIKLNTYLIMLTLWFYWLLFEWLFLHVFEDSMVNYLFFITYWLLFSYMYSKSHINN